MVRVLKKDVNTEQKRNPVKTVFNFLGVIYYMCVLDQNFLFWIRILIRNEFQSVCIRIPCSDFYKFCVPFFDNNRLKNTICISTSGIFR